jgi:hypothetical protein
MKETMTLKCDAKEKCRICGSKQSNPRCPACVEMETLLMQRELGVEGTDM